MKAEMTPMERTLTAMRHQEPDRVPLLLSLTMHGAKALGMSIQSYYSKADNIVRGQVKLRERYGHDILNTFTHASAEFEAFGGTTTYYEDGPPNSGEPVLRAMEDIESLEAPDPKDHAGSDGGRRGHAKTARGASVQRSPSSAWSFPPSLCQ